MFTQCVIETIDEAALEKFGDYSKFSRVAWAEYKNQAGTWRAIRNPRKNGKARALYMEDLICISNALGIPLSELFFRIEQRIKGGWQPAIENDAKPSLPPTHTREETRPVDNFVFDDDDSDAGIRKRGAA